MEDNILMRKSKYLNHYLTHLKQNVHPDCLPTLASLEEGYICYLLELTGNNLAKTADILNLHPDLLFNRLKKYDVWL